MRARICTHTYMRKALLSRKHYFYNLCKTHLFNKSRKQQKVEKKDLYYI